jgi:hypothetical protein
MNKLYVLKTPNDLLFTVFANFVPPGSVGEMPKDENGEYEKVEYLSLQMIENELGQEEQVIVVDQELKAQILAQRSAEAADKEAERLATQYQRDRQSAYPPIGNQLDAIYKKFALDDSTEYDAIAAQIAAVKAQFPKPE